MAKPIKKSGSFQGSSNKLGGGGRFKQLVAQGKSPELAAFIGRKSLGKKKFQSLAAKGRKRSMKSSPYRFAKKLGRAARNLS